MLLEPDEKTIATTAPAGLSWPVAVDVIKRQKLECFLMAAGTTNASAAVMQKCLAARATQSLCGC